MRTCEEILEKVFFTREIMRSNCDIYHLYNTLFLGGIHHVKRVRNMWGIQQDVNVIGTNTAQTWHVEAST